MTVFIDVQPNHAWFHVEVDRSFLSTSCRESQQVNYLRNDKKYMTYVLLYSSRGPSSTNFDFTCKNENGNTNNMHNSTKSTSQLAVTWIWIFFFLNLICAEKMAGFLFMYNSLDSTPYETSHISQQFYTNDIYNVNIH